MVHQRVELNAMTSEQLVAFIERKLAEQGVKKIVPAKETLDEAYRLFERGRRGADQLVAADGGFSAPRSNLSQPVLGAASGAAKSDRPATSSILRAGALVRRKVRTYRSAGGGDLPGAIASSRSLTICGRSSVFDNSLSDADRTQRPPRASPCLVVALFKCSRKKGCVSRRI
jgi:hypothetical protein